MSKFHRGARVAWTYTHAIYPARFKRTKHGTVHHDCKEGGILNGLVAVRFDGNKTLSRVPASELKWLEQEPIRNVAGNAEMLGEV